MLKILKISGFLISFLLLQAFQPEKTSLLFRGVLDCNSGTVKLTRNPFASGSREESFPSLEAARERLRSLGYSEAGVAKLSEILTAVCKQEISSDPGPAIRPKEDQSFPAPKITTWETKPTRIKPGPGSLVWLEKRQQIVTFAVFRDTSRVVEYDASGRPVVSTTAERVAGFVMHKGETDCKPISNVCVKCSDGKIICSTPRLQ